MKGRPRRRPAGDRDLVFGRRPVLELLASGQPIEEILLLETRGRPDAVVEIAARAGARGVATRALSRPEMADLVGEVNHQGVVAVVPPFRYASYEGLLEGSPRALLFLDGVMDPHNLGSLLRSADGAGIDGVVVRIHRGVGVTPAVRRVSAGASETVPVARVTNMSRALEQARSSGLWVIGLDASGDQDLWSSELIEPPIGLVLGAEDKGISRSVAQRCDARVRIPLEGRLGSLNVAVAGAIAMFELARRLRT